MKLFVGILISSLVALSLTGQGDAYKSYSGYQVFGTAVLDEEKLGKIAPLMKIDEYDFWILPALGRASQIMTSPKHAFTLWNKLVMLGLEPHVLVPDVEVILENQRIANEKAKSNPRNGRAPVLDRYLTFDELQAYIDEVAATYPSIASIINIGTSYEGRPLRILKLSNGPGKNGIFFDSANHAREWVGPPTVMYAINELTENLAANQAMLDKNDFYFLIVANPDGYTYTWTDDRMWRKTRSPNAGSACVGTDPNRNFDNHWGEGGEGPCSDVYPGSAPNSEPEIAAFSSFITSETSITFYVAVHSYGQYMLSPWCWTVIPPPDITELSRVGNDAAAAIQAVAGTVYTVGPASTTLYMCYGTSVDWAYSIGVPYSYTIELPSGTVLGGFDPPPEYILPIAVETWEAYKVFAANVPSSRIPPP